MRKGENTQTVPKPPLKKNIYLVNALFFWSFRAEICSFAWNFSLVLLKDIRQLFEVAIFRYLNKRYGFLKHSLHAMSISFQPAGFQVFHLPFGYGFLASYSVKDKCYLSIIACFDWTPRLALSSSSLALTGWQFASQKRAIKTLSGSKKTVEMKARMSSVTNYVFMRGFPQLQFTI